MAYYSSNFYEGDTGEFYGNPSYTVSYDIVPFQESKSYSSYEISEPNFFEYNSTAYSESYDPYLTRSEINNSTYRVTEPKLLLYNPNPYGTNYFSSDPNPYGTHYFSSETQYVVSYSTKSELGDTEFVEYDPTPYGGGYDPALTYGKPLPPSDEICYPRSLPASNVLSLADFSYGSIPSPYANDKIDEYSEKPRDRTEPTKSTEEQQQQPGMPTDSSRGEQVEDYTYDDYYPWSGYGSNGVRNEDYGSGYGDVKQVPQAPYGYGLDAMDLCESIFGYWPCLSRHNKRNYNGDPEVAGKESQGNQWMRAADCLFGSPYTHGGDEAVNYGEPTYNHDRHYHEQYYR